MKTIKKILLLLLIAIIIVCVFIISQGYGLYKDALKNISLTDKIAEIKSDEHYTLSENISNDFKVAIVAVEDHRFEKHNGFDFISTFRAIFNNVKSMSIVEGGSTITQQLAKNLYFTQEQKFTRKIAELIVAFDLEKNYSKDDILELYVNTIYFGNGYYGIYEASMGYFNKKPIDLSLDEATLLAGIPNAPSVYALNNNPKLAKERRKQVVDAMIKYNCIDEQEVNNLIK